jgi:predicted transcriptional regulator
MSNQALPELDPMLHSALRLSIISILVGVKEADFNFLKEKTNATNGNISVQISKLKEAEFIDVYKAFENNYPKTTCKITKKGLKAFEQYVQDLKIILNQKM